MDHLKVKTGQLLQDSVTLFLQNPTLENKQNITLAVEYYQRACEGLELLESIREIAPELGESYEVGTSGEESTGPEEAQAI